jgi:RNA polymerase sigma-70 factor, ECF subfamily
MGAVDVGLATEDGEGTARGEVPDAAAADLPAAVPATFDDLYGDEYAPLVALAWELCGDRWAAEELVQEAFLRAHQRWSVVSRYDRPGAWVRRVVVNLATSRRRRLVTAARAAVRLRTERPPEPALSWASADFWAAVRRLPARQAQVVALYYEADRSVGDVAGMLGCAEGTVRAHLHRARRALAAALAVDEDEDGEDR